MQKNILFFLIVLISTLMIACSEKNAATDKSEVGKKNARPTLVTVTQVNNQAIETTEESIGTLEGLTNPTLSAEVSARVIKIHVNTGEAVKQGQLIATLDASDFGMQRNEAQAEVARIEAQLVNQERTVERNQALINKKFISQNAVDNEVAQQNVLREQLAGAEARVNSINHNSSKTRIYAPASGNVEKKLVDDGEFVKVGDPIILIVSKQHLRAHLPFPEHIAAKLKPGLVVRLTSPTSETGIKTVIHELKPMIVEGSRSVDVIADLEGSANWQPGASVTGTVILGELAAALMVPEQSVVLRPAGEVVYVVRNNKAYQAIVKTGAHQNGMVELINGVNENDTIVVDGAGFLTDDTTVKIAGKKSVIATVKSTKKTAP
jgi:RND family efflux transporter MFP subunit